MKVVNMANVLSYRDFQGSIEISMEDNCLFGRVLHIDDVITYEGDSPQKLEESFKAAIENYLEFCKEQGVSPNRPFKGVFNVRISPDLHKKAVLFASSKGITLNEMVKDALAAAVNIENKVIYPIVHKHEYHIHAGESDGYDDSNDIEGGAEWLKNLQPKQVSLR